MTFAAYVTSIVGAVCLTVLIEVFLSDGETKKYVKGVCTLLVFAVIITPLPRMFDSDFSFIQEEATYAEENADYLERVYRERYKVKELQTQKLLAAEGYADVTVRITLAEVDGSPKIVAVIVDKTQIVINAENANKNIARELILLTAGALSVEEAIVIVTG